MNTYTKAERYPVGSVGHSKNRMRIHLIEPDPKRDGLYIWSELQTKEDSKARRFCRMYGKCNQAAIMEAMKTMIKI